MSKKTDIKLTPAQKKLLEEIRKKPETKLTARQEKMLEAARALSKTERKIPIPQAVAVELKSRATRVRSRARVRRVHEDGEATLRPMTIRVLSETQKVISEVGKILGVHSDPLMIRILLEASVRIIMEPGHPPSMPPILAAARGAMRDSLPPLQDPDEMDYESAQQGKLGRAKQDPVPSDFSD